MAICPVDARAFLQGNTNRSRLRLQLDVALLPWIEGGVVRTGGELVGTQSSAELIDPPKAMPVR